MFSSPPARSCRSCRRSGSTASRSRISARPSRARTPAARGERQPRKAPTRGVQARMTVPREMQAMVLERAGTALRAASLEVPEPGPGEILIKVAACGVCRTDLHIFDGELAQPKLPLVLGHEIVGHVATLWPGVAEFAVGDRVGVPWLGWTDGTCFYCRSD